MKSEWRKMRNFMKFIARVLQLAKKQLNSAENLHFKLSKFKERVCD